jgi:hypothetical protein
MLVKNSTSLSTLNASAGFADQAVFDETWHFHWAKSGEYVTQVTAIGPLGLEYHDPQDDPRRRNS